MLKALLWKELRAGWPFAVLPLIGQIIIAAHLRRAASLDRMGVLEQEHGPLFWTGLLSVILGIALGLWQTIPETAMGTASFLAHVGRVRARVVAAKILAAATLFAISLVFPLAVSAVLIIGLTADWIVPLTWTDTRHLWVIVAVGFVGYLGILAGGLRGAPWKEGFRQLAGLLVSFTGIVVALASPWFGLALGSLLAAALVLGTWAFSGYGAREF